MKGRGRGFTLVEVLIGLTLVTLVLLGLLSALRTFGIAGTRLDAHTSQGEEIRIVSGFVRQVLGSATPVLRPLRADGAQAPVLAGDDHSLSWLGVMPARQGGGGLHVFTLALQDHDGARALVLHFQPYLPPRLPPGTTAYPPASARQQRVLVAGLEGFSLAYQGLGERAWVASWDDEAALPARIMLRIAAAGEAWPDLVVAIPAAEVRSNRAPRGDG